MKEKWAVIPEFTTYLISDSGRVVNRVTNKELRHNQTVYGDRFVKLYDGEGNGFVRSVRVLVASAYVHKPNDIFDTVIMLDGDRGNLQASNLQWKPRWYALRYAQKVDFPFEFDI